MIVIAAFAFLTGVLVGRFVTQRIEQHDLIRAHAKGLLEGQSESSWEIHRLRSRVHALELSLRTIPGRSKGGAQ